MHIIVAEINQLADFIASSIFMVNINKHLTFMSPLLLPEAMRE